MVDKYTNSLIKLILIFVFIYILWVLAIYFLNKKISLPFINSAKNKKGKKSLNVPIYLLVCFIFSLLSFFAVVYFLADIIFLKDYNKKN